ncbi:MAG TPA: hypothetical protein VKB80_09650 [Kofleriaceae bacterium]|nr:hypothetical protein [Kofleriaceae bacterium]
MVANAGYTNASEERESLLEALRRSGEPSGEWVRAAAQRIDDIRTFVEDKSLGEAAEVGCWAAGCGVKITFKDTHSTSRLELLADPVNHGAWRPGVVITSPADDSDGRPSSYLFLVAPSDPRSR